jgi:sn-glycerol 3-phosphate transport system substrate-binding protein
MRGVALIIACVAAALLVAACRGGGPRTTDGRTEIVFWHSMGGVNGDALQRMTDGFNGSQDAYFVRPIFQGGFPDSLKKLVSSFGTNSMPALIQLDDIQLRFMVDSEATVPIQDFIDRDDAASGAVQGYPSSVDLADFEPRALAYYSLEGRLQAMPFNLSGPILYYDKNAFREAGLDPERPPTTFDEVRAYSERLLKRDERGDVTRNGIALNISAWYFEQMLAKQGALYANNGNGREALATEVRFDGPQGEQILTWWQSMVDSRLATNVGQQGLQALLSVLSGKSAMAIESTAAMRSVLLALGPEAARFGAGPLPAPYSPDGGIVMGGAAAWIMSDRPEIEQRGAWEFLKYATRPDIQAQWHVDTGYFPVRVSAWDMEPAASLHRDVPQFTAAHEQLLGSPLNLATAGAVIGPFTQVREAVVEALEQVLVGDKEPREALDAAADEANRAIERYNRSVTE